MTTQKRKPRQDRAAERAEKQHKANSSFQPIPMAELQKWAETTQPRHYTSLTRSLVEIHDAGDALDVERLRKLSRARSPMVKRIAINALARAEAGDRYDSTIDAWHAIQAFFTCSPPYFDTLRQFANQHRDRASSKPVSDERVNSVMRLGESLKAFATDPETPPEAVSTVMHALTELFNIVQEKMTTAEEFNTYWPHIAEMLLAKPSNKSASEVER